MTLPISHPPVPEHIHQGRKCPFADANGKHGWCNQPTDSRSPCPALNTLANHGYLPRNGENIGLLDLIRALRAGYKLSGPLAIFIAVGGFVLLRRCSPLKLYHLGRHGRIEHNASLVHGDTPAGNKYAPAEIHQELVELLMRDAQTVAERVGGPDRSQKRLLISEKDVARARIRREKESPPLDAVHAEIARGEMAIILGVLEVKEGNTTGVPVEWMKDWISRERLPDGWRPTRTQGLINTINRSGLIRRAMKEISQGASVPLFEDDKAEEDLVEKSISRD